MLAVLARTLALASLALGLIGSAAGTAAGGGGDPGVLYWNEWILNRIWTVDLDGGVPEMLVQVSGPVRGLAVDTAHGKIYWSVTDLVPDKRRIRRANLDGSEIEDAVIGTAARSMLVDPVGEKLYWSDDDGDIRRAELDGSDPRVVATPMGNGAPLGFFLYPPPDADPTTIYWVEETSEALARSNLDGSGVEVLATGLDDPGAIAFDPLAALIYIEHGGHGRVTRTGLDGMGLETVVEGLGIVGGITLDADAQLYITTPAAGTILRLDPDSGQQPEEILTGLGWAHALRWDAGGPSAVAPTSWGRIKAIFGPGR